MILQRGKVATSFWSSSLSGNATDFCFFLSHSVPFVLTKLYFFAKKENWILSERIVEPHSGTLFAKKLIVECYCKMGLEIMELFFLPWICFTFFFLICVTLAMRRESTFVDREYWTIIFWEIASLSLASDLGHCWKPLPPSPPLLLELISPNRAKPFWIGVRVDTVTPKPMSETKAVESYFSSMQWNEVCVFPLLHFSMFGTDYLAFGSSFDW